MTRQQLAKPVFGALTAATETAIDDHQTAALIGAASYRHNSRHAALRAQYEGAATAIRAEFLAEVARLPRLMPKASQGLCAGCRGPIPVAIRAVAETSSRAF